MLWYAWVLLAIALLAAVLGFGGIAVAAAGIAKICFVVFLLLFLVSLVMGRRVAPKQEVHGSDPIWPALELALSSEEIALSL